MLLERRTRSTIWDSKEPASCSLHCFHEGLQIQVYLFHVHNRVVWRLRWPCPRDLLLPTLFGPTEPLPSDLRQLVALTPAQGGLGVPDLRFEAPQQFAASTSITAPHVDSITTYSMFMVAGENSTEELKRQHQALKTASVKSRMEGIDSTLPSRICCSQLTNRETRVWAHGSPQCLLSINAWCWINKNSLRLSYIIIHSKYFPDPDWLKAHV